MSDKEFIYNFLKDRNTFCLSTTDGIKPWICTAFYSIDKDLNLVFASSEATRHSRELKKNEMQAAVAVYNHESAPTVLVEGVQIEGRITVAKPNELPKIFKLFSKGLPKLAKEYSVKELIEYVSQSRLYVFKPEHIKYLGPNKKLDFTI